MQTKKTQKRNGRRGAAIEFAVLVLLVVFGASALLVSVSLIQTNKKKTLGADYQAALVLDQVGESFLNAVKAETLDEWSTDGATVYGTNGENEIKMTYQTSNQTLTVVLQKTDAGYEITEWTRG